MKYHVHCPRTARHLCEYRVKLTCLASWPGEPQTAQTQWLLRAGHDTPAAVGAEPHSARVVRQGARRHVQAALGRA